jgi:hypothetical protein
MCVWEQKLTECLELAEEEMAADKEGYPGRNPRRTKANPLMCRNDEGVLVPLRPKGSTWYAIYVESPQLDNKKFHQKFRKRFRTPYSHFLELVRMVKESDLFKRWLSFDAVGKESSPIELMVLGALRYLGRGWTFDDLEESTAIHEETHRVFFHVFVEWGSTVFFDSYVVHPTNAEEAAMHTHEMGIAGFDGCVGSTDATRVGMERCSYRVANINTGSKLSMPSRTYNMTVNHRRHILSTTCGHPARWNDPRL